MSTPESPLQKFQALLGEMLQTEKSDLDFGIYRVVGHRRGDMEDFITKTIPDAVKKAVADASPHNSALKEKEELERDIRTQHNDPFTPDGELRPQFADGGLGKKWRDVCARASGAQLLTAPDVYNRLLQFFGRYYHEGDFVSKRRYAGNAKYAVPYDGREVLLHWANRDQYYVKTADRFAQYALTADNAAFQFRVEKTKAQKDNNKPPKGVFILADAREENGRIVAVFHRREPSEEEKENSKSTAKNGDQQAKIIALAEKKIKDGEFPLLAPLLASHPTQKEKSRFAVHAARFVRRNTSDYFIHRNLRAFLRRELDFFLKNETINADELAENTIAQNRIAAFRAVRNVARQVIDMLAQWEDFQKALWEKKKFILQTDYCATLGRIPKWENCGILNDIADCDEQWKEWKNLGTHGESSALFSANGKGKREKRIAFLRENPSLPVDTAHFPPEFKDRLLAQFPNLDDATDGVLFHGDNWQALNLMQEMYRGRVKCIYIDPPYNTGPSEILYRNEYKHSSWLCLMENRVSLSGAFMRPDGVFICAIDENEMLRLGMMLTGIFPPPTYETNCLTVIHNPKGIQGGFISVNNEYAFVVNQSGQVANTIPIPEKEWEWENFRNWGGESKRETAKNCFYPVIVKGGKIVGFGDVCPDDYHPQRNEPGEDGAILVYPVDNDGIERKWTYARQSIGKIKRLLRAVKKNGGYDIERSHDWRRFKTVWCEKRYIAGDYGSKPLNKILGRKLFDFPKAIPLVMDSIRMAATDDSFVLDYFAGSGTTAHAIVNMNREDGGRRKFILAEMGEHFDTVLLPRVKKVIYSPEWRGGNASRPATAEEVDRGPQLVKYHRIESYEDALDNVDFGNDAALRQLGDFIPRYMLRWESRNSPTFLSDEKLENPFDYKLQLSGESARMERADLPETFAYLIGLRVRTRRVLTDDAGRTKPRYVVCRGECGDAEATAIWRDVSGWTDADYERDRKFVEENGLAAGRVWMNGNTLVSGASVLDLEFREQMFPPLVREDAE